MTLPDWLLQKAARVEATHRFDPDRTALLVIDMQVAFLHADASLAVPPAWDIVPNVQALLAFFRQRRLPVIFTAFVASPDIPTLRVDPFGVEHRPPLPGQSTGFGQPSGSCQRAATGPESAAIIPELAPLAHEPVIQGYSLDKFYGTPLDQFLRAHDIRYLMLTGVMTDLCVLATLFSATTREYRVTLLSDAAATLWPDIQKAVLDIVARKLGRVLTTQAALTELQGASA
ncbi:MAG: cysteine hydrolase [Anaerolineae bacterium]|nr:cysteine hydrolase [Anaerolineae bacterium]